jgi:hypothetical protein
MRKQIIGVTCVFCVLVGLVFAEDKKSKDTVKEAKTDGSAKRVMIVYPARSAPVNELTSTLSEVFENSEVSVVADNLSNLLIIQVDEKSREKVLSLLEQLDKPLRSVAIQVHLLKTRGKDLDEVDLKGLSGSSDEVQKRIRELERAGRIYVANRMQLTALENQKSMLQVGERVAVETGSMVSREGSRISNYKDYSVGTIISVQTRVSEDSGITMNFDFEKSEVVPGEKSDDKAVFVPSSTATLVTQTTVQLRDGHSVLAGNLVSRSANETEEAYLIVGARIVDAGDAAKKVTFRSFTQRQPINTAARSFSPSSRNRATSGFQRSSSSADSKERLARMASAMMARYDTNKDNVLTAEEWKKMPSSTSDADADKDGKITAEEFSEWIVKRGFRSRSQPPSSRGSD